MSVCPETNRFSWAKNITTRAMSIGWATPDRLSELTFYAVAQYDEEASKARIARRCKQIGVTPRRIELLDNFPTLINVLRETRGVSICARFSLFGPRNDIKYYPLNLTYEKAYIVVAWHTDRLSRQARDFIGMLPDFAEL